jgi:hypothetical protein
MFGFRDPSLSEYYDFDAIFYLEVLACTLNTAPISFFIYSVKRNFARLG